MYLAKLEIKKSRLALGWLSNHYRIHQRLLIAYRQEPRLLYRVEEGASNPVILVQSSTAPVWADAFSEFDVLSYNPEVKQFTPVFQPEGLFHFRLTANPTVTRNNKRFGLFREEDQLSWIQRQMKKSGCDLIECQVTRLGLQRSGKYPVKDPHMHTHFGAQFDGTLKVVEPEKLAAAVQNGIGPAKAYGFGLLSLAPFQDDG